ncbi:MAG: hypothetical protein L0338_39610 [Acidobacteria bacterium]|nr:hypothetical protein [Acidobacteriota bacterium]
MAPLTQVLEGELFYFGMALDKFALHKAGRVKGLVQWNGKNCFLLEYGDGETAHAEFVEESQGAYELLTYEAGVAKYGEGAFQ